MKTCTPTSLSCKLLIVICTWILLEGTLCSSADICGPEEEWCSMLDENEKLAYEAIGCLHRQLDDNKDGSINLDESDDFLREELKYEKDYEKRQKVFHSNNDHQVSIRELWDTWVKSEVHNWTVEQTLEWLGTFVGLPQYEVIFTKNSINGTFLPRLAVNHQQFLTNTLGVKDLINKQKIALKAQDVVLFGPPKDYGNRTKDIVLSTLLGVAVIVCWFLYARYKTSERDLNKMIKDMELLATAEKELLDLQKEMEKTKAEKQQIEEPVTPRASMDAGVHASDSDELLNLRGEVEVLRGELQRAELELQDKCWVPPPALQHWLQLTYELELKSYNRKKQSAEKQLRQAKDACDKLKKKRSSLMGAFVSTHGRSIDDVDKAISEARSSLTDVTQELQERMHRWKQIEMLVNCPIMNNAGLAHLESILRSYGKVPSFAGLGSVMSNSQDDIDDDGASSIYCPSAVHKLVSQSTYMMYPAHQNPHSVPFSRTCTYQPPPSDLLSSGNLPSTSSGGNSASFSCSGGGRPLQPANVAENGKLAQEGPPTSKCISHSQSSNCPLSNEGDISSESSKIVSVPVSRNYHLPIVRSKSVSNMSSLRDRSMASPGSEPPSKDFTNLEDDFAGEPFEMRAVSKDRRVTFGIHGRTANDKRDSYGNKRGNSLLMSKPTSGDCDGLLIALQKVEQNDTICNVVQLEEECRNSCTANGSISKEEPDLIKLSSNYNNGSLKQSINSKSEPKNDVEHKINNHILANQKISTQRNATTHKTLSTNDKKPGIWKRFSNLIESKKNQNENNKTKHGSTRSRYKVFSSEYIKSDESKLLPAFVDKDNDEVVEKNGKKFKKK